MRERCTDGWSRTAVFLDYLATGKLNPEQLTQVVAGISQGCKQAGCALLGGETAEMPGFYQVGEYDLAGFCVGMVEKSQMLNGSQVKLGDVAIALASQGVHSNGFSLVRKIVTEGGFDWSDRPALFQGQNLGETILTPTRIYVKPVLAARQAGLEIHGMAHITGVGCQKICLVALVQVNLSKSIPALGIFYLSFSGWLKLAQSVPHPCLTPSTWALALYCSYHRTRQNRRSNGSNHKILLPTRSVK